MKALLLDAWRGRYHRRGPTAVTVGGLMLAMAACLIVALLASALAAPDPAIRDPDRVILLDFKGNIPGQPTSWFTASPIAFATMLKERNVPLDLISRASGNGLDIEMNGRLHPTFLLIADPDLVLLLGLKALHGDLVATLKRHDGIAVTPRVVRNLWGDLPVEQAMGRRFASDGIFYTITAIIPDFDPRSPVGRASPLVGDAKAMVGFETQGNKLSQNERTMIYAGNGRVFARLRPGVSADEVGSWMRDAFVADARYSELPAEWKAGGREAAFFRGLPLVQLPYEGDENQQRWQLLSAVAAASALLLLLAAFNCMNLEMANLLRRQRETALRRSLGADGPQLLRLWGMEVLLSLVLAAAGAMLLAWWFAPGIANWAGLLVADYVTDPIPARALLGLAGLVVALLVIVLVPPAWRALRRTPAPALQGRTMSEGPWGRRTRQALLTLQLAGAVSLLLLAGVLTWQQRHLMRADRGFDTRNRLWLGFMVNPEKIPNLDAFVAGLNRHPAVEHWSFGGGMAMVEQGAVDVWTGTAEHERALRLSTVSPAFFATYGMTVLAGVPRTGTGEINVVIDAKAAKGLGFANPEAAVGALVRGGGGYMQAGNEPRRVVAVVKDVKLESAREAAMPQGFILKDDPQWDMSFYGPDLAALREAVEGLWKTLGPGLPYTIESADSLRASVYKVEQQMTAMLTAVALLAVGVAMLGAYTLVSDTLRRRRTELVLHRLHGASHGAIVRVVTREFVVPLLAAFVVGVPIGAWLGGHYLAGFVDRISLGPGLAVPALLACGVLVLVVAIGASRHVRQALSLQPIEALR
ncbi:MAG TPA: FtsX-like permease family protein [Steroidobacteraceae bacterium]